MPKQLALLLTIGFIVYMLKRFGRDSRAPNAILWLPVVWIFFIASRFPGQWLSLFGMSFLGGSMEEGSPFDAAFFLTLIIIGSVALQKRNFTLASLARENIWLTLFFTYCFCSIFWSDFPFVAFKRWIKTLGHPVMALLILTEVNPILAFRLVMKRAAFIMLPLSVMFIKYFPEYGRGFDFWSGAATNQGITLNKNELGYGCLIFGIFFVGNLLFASRIEDKKARRQEILLSLGFLAMIFWLLKMAQSATSLVTLIIGSAVVIGLGFRFVSKKYFGTTVLTTILVVGTAELTIGIYAPTLALLGRDASLTDRTEVWADALNLMDSPLLGTGFESYWLGDRLKTLWAKWWWRPTQAHNGYIETYLHYGAIGVFLMLGLLLGTFRKITKKLSSDFDFARLRMGFLFAIILYNFTEATFKGLSFVWTMFYLISLDTPRSPTPSAFTQTTPRKTSEIDTI